MNQADGYVMPTMVSDVSVDERTAFIRRTYAHLTGAIFAFAGMIWVLFQTGVAKGMFEAMVGNQMMFLLYLVGFIFVSWIAAKWARSDRSSGMQYLGLGVYVFAQALIFSPILYYANELGLERGTSIIESAATTTLAIFAGLTIFVFTTKKDFSFLRGILVVASLVAGGAILCSFLFGFGLGTFFTIAMIALAAGYILYYTSNIIHHYQTHQHVAAALALFASVALLFWYVLQLFMSRE